MSKASQDFSEVHATNIAVGTLYHQLAFKDFSFLAIGTGALTNVTVTIEASIREDGDQSVGWYDVTNDLCATASLAANTLYLYARALTYNNLRIKYVTSMGTNAVNFDVMLKKEVS